MKSVWSRAIAALLCVCFVNLASAQVPADGPYKGHKLVRIDAKTSRDVLALSSLGTVLECRPGVGTMHLVLSDEALEAVNEMGLVAVTLVEDYQTIINEQRAINDAALAARGGFFSAYQTNDSINTFTQGLTDANPAILSRSVIGQSHEGRDIFSLLLTAPYAVGEPRRPQVVLNGCQHAREWISPASVLYILNEMVSGFGNDPQIDEMLSNLEFHIIPMCNPDGYEYTHDTFRLWRKNRRPVGGAVGVDLNRNWSFEWGGTGSSGTPSSDVYRGPSPFSEPETTVVSTFLSTLPDVHAHIDFHSFGQLLLGPWGYTTSTLPPRVDELVPAQNEMASAMFAPNGMTYLAGLGTDALLGAAAGIMPDWTFEVLDALSWTIELRPNSGFPGFELPPGQIIPAAEEAFEAVKVLAGVAARSIQLVPLSPIPTEVSSESPTDLSVSVTEWNLETLLPGSASLQYRIGTTGSFTEITLIESGGAFLGSLPPVPCGQMVQFFFRAESVDGAVATLPDGAPGNVFEAAGSPLTIIFEDNFQSNTGWSVSGAVSDGAWERALPIGGGDRGDPASDSDGSGLCFLTDAADGNSDVDGGTTILTSPVFDLSNGGTLSYDYWADSTGAFNSDSLAVEIATNAAGTNWVQVRNYTTPVAAWQNDSIAVGSETPASSTVRIRFLASDLGSPSVIECGIDRVSVSESGSCCPGDCDGSLTVDFNDLVAMLFEFGMPGTSEACDADASGTVEFNDLITALFLFGPCP